MPHATDTGRQREGRGERRPTRGGAILDAILFQVALVLTAALLVMTTVLPAYRRADGAEANAKRLEREVQGVADRVTRLRREIRALQSDPPYIERMLKRRMRDLKPHKFEPQPLPPPYPPTSDAPSTPTTTM